MLVPRRRGGPVAAAVTERWSHYDAHLLAQLLLALGAELL
jgi:hypothetical protein